MQYPIDLDVTPELAELAAARAELEARGIFVMPAAAETELSGRWAVRSRAYGSDPVEAVVLAGADAEAEFRGLEHGLSPQACSSRAPR